MECLEVSAPARDSDDPASYILKITAEFFRSSIGDVVNRSRAQDIFVCIKMNSCYINVIIHSSVQNHGSDWCRKVQAPVCIVFFTARLS